MRLLDSIRFRVSKDKKVENKIKNEASNFIDQLDLEIVSANTKEQTEVRESLARLNDALVNIYGKKARLVIKDLEKPNAKFSRYSVKDRDLSKAHLIQIYATLVQKDDYAQQLEIREQKLGKGYLRLVESELSDKDLALVDFLRSDYAADLPSLSAVTEEVNGLPTISTGPLYMPAAIEQPLGGIPEEHKVSIITPKALIPRRKNNLDIDENVSVLTIWAQRKEDYARFKAHAKLAQDIRFVFASGEVQESLALVHGKENTSELMDHVADQLSGGYKDPNKITALDKLRAAVTLTSLSINMNVAVKQVTSIPAFGFRIGLFDVSKHLASFINPANVSENFNIAQLIINSDQRKNRFKTGNEEQVENALKNGDMWGYFRLLQAGMLSNAIGDLSPTLIVGTGIYKDAFSRYKKTMNEEKAQEKALDYLFSIVQSTQQSREVKDLSLWQRRAGWAGRFLGQFTSTVRQFSEFEISAIRAFAAKQSGENALTLSRVLLINHFLLPTFFQTMGILYQGLILGVDIDPEEEFDRWVVNAIAGPARGIVIVGSITERTIDRLLTGNKSFGRSVLPADKLITLVGGGVGAVANLLQLDFDEAMKEFDLFISGATPLYRDIRKFYENRLN